MVHKKISRPSTSAGNAVARARGRRTGGLLAAAAAVVVIALAAVIAFALVRQHGGAGPAARGDVPATVAVGADTPPPWPAPADATAAVRAAGLPMLDAEGTVLHIHSHLDVVVDGKPVPVPALVGIDLSRGTISPVHTHDTSGVIHIESPTQHTFTLGEFFREWGVSLSSNNVGALHAGNGKTVRVYVNGVPREGNPADIALGAHDEIVVTYGSANGAAAVPSRYDFPEGE
ncbi:hypothetical protein ABIA39_003078 [Nocardia sp. GAS34]|uniref:hypothetical protein n=1 Tax=unclassified Nocardia TaxID=2637762 RepID=UPI003D263355